MKKEKPASLAEQVVLRLQKDISSGRYKEGGKIPPEPELMANYGVGRSTVREAVRSLVNAGILRVQQGSGTFVTAVANIQEPLEQRLKKAVLKEVNDVRILLEKEIVRLAALHRTAKDLKQIKAALAGRRHYIFENRYDACAEEDIRFHIAIAMASHNSVLTDLYGTFTHTIRNFFSKRDAARDVSWFMYTHDWHEQLLAAIEARNAEEAMRITVIILENNY